MFTWWWSQSQIYPWLSVLKFVPINQVDVEIFHWISEHFDLLVWLHVKSTGHQVITIYLEGNMNVNTKFHDNPCHNCRSVSKMFLMVLDEKRNQQSYIKGAIKGVCIISEPWMSVPKFVSIHQEDVEIFHWIIESFYLLVTSDEMSGHHKNFIIDHKRRICTEFHGSPPNSCRDIWLKTKNVNLMAALEEDSQNNNSY